MKLSIAMASYNGITYLPQQLDSLLVQTVPPDELIVCDDCSEDGTYEILRKFQENAPFPVVISRNKSRIGYAKNFEKVISQCSGDIIFLCDQDDVWFPNKVEKIVSAFDSDENALVVVHDAGIVDDDMKNNGITVAGQLLSIGLSSEYLLLGCCIAFHSKLMPLIIPVPYPIHGHDGWINTLGNVLQCRVFVPEVLQFYRRHDCNTSSQRFTSTQRISRFDVFIDMIAMKNIRVSPEEASLRRLKQIDILVDRIILHRVYIEKCLGLNERYTIVLSELKQVKVDYQSRYAIQRLPYLPRLIIGMKFYLEGGYKRFEGVKSFIRDVLGGSIRGK